MALISRALPAHVEGSFPSFQANPFRGEGAVAKTQLLLSPPGTGNNGWRRPRYWVTPEKKLRQLQAGKTTVLPFQLLVFGVGKLSLGQQQQ